MLEDLGRLDGSRRLCSALETQLHQDFLGLLGVRLGRLEQRLGQCVLSEALGQKTGEEKEAEIGMVLEDAPTSRSEPRTVLDVFS